MQKSASISLQNSIVDTKVRSTEASVPRTLALVPAGLAFILYLVTCSPTVNFTDSGELTTVAWTASIAHPSGYPLYTLLGIVAVHIPFGDPAWRMNMLSALFAALAVGLFYLLVTDLLIGLQQFQRLVAQRVANSGSRTSPGDHKARASKGGQVPPKSRPKNRAATAGVQGGKKNATSPVSSSEPAPRAAEIGDQTLVLCAAVAGGLAAASLLAVSVTFWNWATQAKLYSLHFAFVAGILWLALRARRALVSEIVLRTPMSPRWPMSGWSPGMRLLHILVFTFGLSLTNHYLTFLLVPGIVALLLSTIRYARETTRRIFRHLGTLILAGLIPLLLYLYLPIRASMHPLIAWGLPDTWNGFWRQVTAESYRGLFGTANFGNHLIDFVTYTANQFGPWLGIILLVPITMGLVYLWQTDRGLLFATALVAFVDVLAALNYSIREIATYYVPFYMIALLWAGLGVSRGVVCIGGQLPTLFARPQGETNERAATSPRRNAASSLALGALLPLIALAINWGAAGHLDNYTADLFVTNAFKNYRPNALVFTDYWDFTSASLYYQHVLGQRPDVTIVDKSLLRQPFYLDYLERNYPDLISKNAGPYAAYKSLLLQWINTGKTPQQLPTAYYDVLNGFIDSNLGQRPVYADFVVPASDPVEQEDVDAILGKRQSQLVPDGFGYRIAGPGDDKSTKDPQFDLRGVTTDKVPLDEIDSSIVALYPIFLQKIGTYLQSDGIASDKQVGANLLAQAQQLQPLEPLQDERPRLR